MAKCRGINRPRAQHPAEHKTKKISLLADAYIADKVSRIQAMLAKRVKVETVSASLALAYAVGEVEVDE